MRPIIVLAFALTACGGSGASAEVDPTDPPETPTPWPEEYEEWVCAASDEIRLDVIPAMDDMVQAIDLLDTEEAIAASSRIGDGAAQTLDFLELAPAWGPGDALVEHLTAWMTLLAQGSNEISTGLRTNDTVLVQAGMDAVAAGGDEADAFSDAVDVLQAETGFAC